MNRKKHSPPTTYISLKALAFLPFNSITGRIHHRPSGIRWIGIGVEGIGWNWIIPTLQGARAKSAFCSPTRPSPLHAARPTTAGKAVVSNGDPDGAWHLIQELGEVGTDGMVGRCVDLFVFFVIKDSVR